MKKNMIYTIVILLLILIIAGSTFAYFSTTSIGKNITTNGNKFEVIYLGGNKIDGTLKFSNTKTEDMKTTVSIKVSEDSIVGIADLYIQIENITENIAIKALTWEVYKTYNGKTEYVDDGTFADCKTDSGTRSCKTGDKLYIVNDYKLSTTETLFTVYIWLDGNQATNSAIGGIFKGHIGAETENFTGVLK